MCSPTTIHTLASMRTMDLVIFWVSVSNLAPAKQRAASFDHGAADLHAVPGFAATPPLETIRGLFSGECCSAATKVVLSWPLSNYIRPASDFRVDIVSIGNRALSSLTHPLRILSFSQLGQTCIELTAPISRPAHRSDDQSFSRPERTRARTRELKRCHL